MKNTETYLPRTSRISGMVLPCSLRERIYAMRSTVFSLGYRRVSLSSSFQYFLFRPDFLSHKTHIGSGKCN